MKMKKKLKIQQCEVEKCSRKIKSFSQVSKLPLLFILFSFMLWGCEREQMLEDAPHHPPDREEEIAPHLDENHMQPHDHDMEQLPLNGELELSGQVEEGIRVVEVQARQFEFEPSQIVVEQGEEVRLAVTSEDVMHGIMIMDMEIDEQLPPNQTVTIEFTAEEPGRHHFHCSVYCGPGHEQMHGELVVLEVEE